MAELLPPDHPASLRLMIDSLPGLVFTYTAQGEIDFVNRRMLEHFDLPVEALRTWPAGNLTHEADLERIRNRWREHLQAAADHTDEYRLRGADGIFRWFQLRSSPMMDECGRVIRWCACLTEIDAIMQRHADASEQLRSLESLIDSIPGLVFTTRANGELEWINRTIQAYFGRSFAQLQEWQMTDVVHPEDLPNTIAQWQAGAASGEPYDFEERLLRHDGLYRWFHFRAAPLKDEAGNIVRWAGLVTDIDEMKQAKEEARLNERQLRLILDNIPGFVYTLKPSGEMEQVNQQILDFFGKSFAELRNWESVTHPDDIEPARRRLLHAISTGTPWESEARGRRADGVYRWFLSRGLPLRDTDGSILRWYCVNIDIDDHKRAEEDVHRIQARLSRASQLAAVSEFAASIAHEVNQPLAAVIANGQACHRWLSADPPNVERALLSVQRAIRDGNSAAEIVARIRSLFRHAPPTKQALSLNEVIEEVGHVIADDLRSKGVALQLQLQENLPEASADRVQMHQVIANLARNGIDAMDAVHDRPRLLAIATASV
jgi:PAS domain S-box-containing protein